LVSEIGAEWLTAGPTFSFCCHFSSNLAAFPVRCKRTSGQCRCRRRATREKKEEEFSANRAKKIQAKKILFLAVSFASIPFQR
jgi:hypothetical protein